MSLFRKKSARPSDGSLWASALMTYAQSLRSLGNQDVVERDTFALLFASLVTVAEVQSKRMSDADHVPDMLAVNFEPEARLCAPLLDVPAWSIPSPIYVNMKSTSERLAQEFYDRDMTYDQAFLQGLMAAQKLGANASSGPGNANPYGMGIGVAMKTIRDDTAGPRLAERGGMLFYGSQIGTEWVVRTINYPPVPHD